MSQALSITAYSTALFSTWVFVEQYGLLFDCGDGVTSTLLQKARKVKHVFLSHPDRDHLTGLVQFNQLNGRDGLAMHFPRDAGSFAALAGFTAKFDPHITGTRWLPIAHNETVALSSDLRVRAFENRHVDSRQTKSLSYAVERTRNKLRPEFAGLPGERIATIRRELEEELVFEVSTSLELIYSGDTPVEFDGRYNDTRVLIHEATFLRRDELNRGTAARNQHSSLDAVMEMVADSRVEHLILGHFSSRYDDAEIDAAIKHEKERCGIQIPVDVIHPGRVARFVV